MTTHSEHVAEGYYVTIQYCEQEGCDEYLGVNYPDFYCEAHTSRSRSLSSKE